MVQHGDHSTNATTLIARACVEEAPKMYSLVPRSQTEAAINLGMRLLTYTALNLDLDVITIDHANITFRHGCQPLLPDG